ncbi:MAG: PEP-CTERM sorting domain-containing protein [Planctomycetes bacterium]|nr:PEP-CTERM sorting domain-containing protein [Planctomycetota bacterium]
MRKAAALGVCLCLATASLAVAGDPVPSEFSFTAEFDKDSGAIPDTSVNFFPLIMNDPTIESIVTLELLISGLTHDSPWDLDIYLIDPRGVVGNPAFAVMLDRGDQEAVVGIDLLFSDLGSALPPGIDGLCPGGDCSNLNYLPEDGRGFNDAFGGLPGGMDAWILVIIDDSQGDEGSFDSFTLRGTAVPEPVTLSLLAVGAFAALRRRRS